MSRSFRTDHRATLVQFKSSGPAHLNLKAARKRKRRFFSNRRRNRPLSHHALQGKKPCWHIRSHPPLVLRTNNQWRPACLRWKQDAISNRQPQSEKPTKKHFNFISVNISKNPLCAEIRTFHFHYGTGPDPDRHTI